MGLTRAGVSRNEQLHESPNRHLIPWIEFNQTRGCLFADSYILSGIESLLKSLNNHPIPLVINIFTVVGITGARKKARSGLKRLLRQYF